MNPFEWSQATKDTFAGLFTGMIQMFALQPFELVKTRIQYDPSHYDGVLDCFRKVYREEGFLSFYKGSLVPLIGNAFYVSVIFTSYEGAKRFFSKFRPPEQARLPMIFIMASGVFTGLPLGLVGCPVEHARIRVQIQKGKSSTHQYSGSFDALVKILKSHGIVGLYRGFIPTVIRSSFGNIFYFGVYESFIRLFLAPNQKSSEAPVIGQIIGSVLSGAAFMTSIYPIDFVKTLMQSDSLEEEKRHFRRILPTIKYILKQRGGFRGLYNGISTMYMRSLATSSLSFPVFEATLDLLGRESNKKQ